MLMFRVAADAVMEVEGGGRYSATRGDAGGPTRWGITRSTLSAWRGTEATRDDVRELTRHEAEQILLARYWSPVRAGEIADQRVATQLLGLSVHFGPRRASRILQRAIVRAGGDLRVDGYVGSQTIEQANRMDSAVLMRYVVDMQSDTYKKIVNRNAGQGKFLRGWLSRAERLGRP